MNHPVTNSHAPKVRVLTPSGPGAVAVIEVKLPTTADVALVLSTFSAEPPRDTAQAAINRILYGRWNGEDVVVVRTAEWCWEIHCHGGLAAIGRIASDLTACGAEFRCVGDSPTEDLFAEIEVAVNTSLPRCRTRKTAGLVLAQLTSPLRALIDAARQTENTAQRQSAQDHFERWRSVAEHLIEPWRIAVVGPPNAGKSSLINALAGRQRSIVSATPGTTRDLVEVEIVCEGWTFRLIDTAGVHSSADSELELIGIQRSLEILTRCDVICLVTDVTTMLPERTLTDQIAFCQVPVVFLRNKCDLLEGAPAFDVIPDEHDMSVSCRMDVSAMTGDGLSEFLLYLTRLLIPEEPDSDTALLLPGLHLTHST